MKKAAEERRPCGNPGLTWAAPREGAPELSDCLVFESRPWQLTIWEPLRTKAPGPHLTRPWCCYINTVVFYRRPFLTLPPKPWRDSAGVLRRGKTGSFFAWDEIRTRFAWDDPVAFKGQVFELGGGHVRWHRGWWMCRWARRKNVQQGES